jgi:hypothetical protein
MAIKFSGFAIVLWASRWVSQSRSHWTDITNNARFVRSHDRCFARSISPFLSLSLTHTQTLHTVCIFVCFFVCFVLFFRPPSRCSFFFLENEILIASRRPHQQAHQQAHHFSVIIQNLRFKHCCRQTTTPITTTTSNNESAGNRSRPGRHGTHE